MRVARPTGLSDGARAAEQRAADVDGALLSLCLQALGDKPRLALVAVGGYGAGRLSPHSDIDLLFVWASKVEPDISRATLRNLLYPLWDAGFQVGHAVVTPKEALERCRNDLHALTALLSARPIAGAPTAFEELLERRTRFVGKHRKTLVRRLVEGRTERHAHAERAGWTLAPDLKEDIGGLRDVDHLRWLEALTDGSSLPDRLKEADAVLLAVREALHSEAPRKLDRIRIDLQPQVASRLGIDGDDRADILMEAVHSAARTIEHEGTLESERAAAAVLGGPRRSGTFADLGDGIRVEDGYLRVRSDVPPNPRSALILLACAAETGRRLHPTALRWLDEAFAGGEARSWDEEMRTAFLRVLGAPRAPHALELLDHAGGWSVLMPEWNAIRGRAQHDPYHRYTVDGHSFFTVAMVHETLASDPLARRAVEEAGSIDALLLGALLHDIGKGSGEDHSVAGERIARRVCERLGMSDANAGDVASLVRHHLLFSDTATRRDLDDGAVIAAVAAAVGSGRLARLMYVLTGADGRATGHESWTDWKASLVAELYRRVLVALEVGRLPERSDVGARRRELEAYDPVLSTSAGELLDTLPRSYLASTQVEDVADDLRILLHPPSRGHVACNVAPGWDKGQTVVTVCVQDRPGALARTAGVLALHRMSVLTARAYATTTGLALQRFVVFPPTRADWDALRADLNAAYSGRLALEARLERKIEDYGGPRDIAIDVRSLQDESEHSTVLEIRAPDVLGLLYAITSALSDLDLDIHVAKIDTLGARVVDVFYVRSLDDAKLDPTQETEVERAICHRVTQLLGGASND